jgi:uncharacterized protein (TIGR00369 family)
LETDYLAALKSAVGPSFSIPPPCFDLLKTVIEEYRPGEMLQTTFTVQKEFTNPAGILQGGFFGVAFDNAFGPFSFLELKRPTTTIEMSLSFVRPVTGGNPTVRVWPVAQTKTYYLLAGEMKVEGKLCATATTRMQIL